MREYGVEFEQAAVLQRCSGFAVDGDVNDGHALLAAEVLGCDLGYMGTPFIATTESMAPDAYKEMLVSSPMDAVPSGS